MKLKLITIRFPRTSTVTRRLLTAALVLTGLPPANAAIVIFTGGVPAQDAWRLAAGSYVFEGFEGFAVNAAVTTLPALGLALDPVPAGAQPGIYQHRVNNTPSGPKQLANFPGNCCIVPLYQFGDLSMRVLPGVDIRGFAFWQGDPQSNAVLRIYDLSDVLIGTVTAAINNGASPNFSNSFAGFISTDPIGRLEFEGGVGDGWNHYDDFHVTFGPAVVVPEPAGLQLVGVALAAIWAARRVR